MVRPLANLVHDHDLDDFEPSGRLFGNVDQEIDDDMIEDDDLLIFKCDKSGKSGTWMSKGGIVQNYLKWVQETVLTHGISILHNSRQNGEIRNQSADKVDKVDKVAKKVHDRLVNEFDFWIEPPSAMRGKSNFFARNGET